MSKIKHYIQRKYQLSSTQSNAFLKMPNKSFRAPNIHRNISNIYYIIYQGFIKPFLMTYGINTYKATYISKHITHI